MCIGHRKEIRKLTFRAFALRRSFLSFEITLGRIDSEFALGCASGVKMLWI